jgi:hypothetical protein
MGRELMKAVTAALEGARTYWPSGLLMSDATWQGIGAAVMQVP